MALQVKQNTLSTWKTRNTFDYPKLIAICDMESLDLNYILLGTGQKGNLKGNPKGNLIEKTSEKPSQKQIISYLPEPLPLKVVTVDVNNEDVISLVPVKAAAGYLNGFGDPEFIERLPVLSMPGLKGGTHRAFEVKGNSMLPVHHPGSISIGRYVESLDEIRDRRVYILVTKEGVVLKRVLNMISEEGKLILISDNENKREFPNYPVDVEDILEVWYWRRGVIAESPEPGGIYGRVNEMQAAITLLQAQFNQATGKKSLFLDK